MLTIIQTNVCAKPAYLGKRCRMGGEEVEIYSGIVKKRVETPVVTVGRLGIEGDLQVDTGTVKGKQVHGGELKSVYVLPISRLNQWNQLLGGGLLPGVSFGENWTVDGLDETTVYIGDEFTCGDVRVRVTGARRPCYKLGMHLGPRVPRLMTENGWTGWYFAVDGEGTLPASGAVFELVNRHGDMPTVFDTFRKKMREDNSVPDLRATDS